MTLLGRDELRGNIDSKKLNKTRRKYFVKFVHLRISLKAPETYKFWWFLASSQLLCFQPFVQQILRRKKNKFAEAFKCEHVELGKSCNWWNDKCWQFVKRSFYLHAQCLQTIFIAPATPAVICIICISDLSLFNYLVQM